LCERERRRERERGKERKRGGGVRGNMREGKRGSAYARERTSMRGGRETVEGRES